MAGTDILIFPMYPHQNMVSYRYCVRCGRRTRHARGGVDPAAARPGPMSLDTRPIDAAINGGRHCVECRARVFPARHP